jgi:hypothetical protein
MVAQQNRDSRRKNHVKKAEDYAGGGSDFPQERVNAASPQRGMVDNDMGKYGAVQNKKTPRIVDDEFKSVPGGGSAGSYRKKRSRSAKVANVGNRG